MKFTLKDYQHDAVDDVLHQLGRARSNFHRDGQESSFSLSATTGAGKTVMAAAVIEALFWGSDDFNFDADPGAVVIWFSDDPNLNLQTRNRLRDASEKFNASNLVVIEPPFAQPRLDPGKVYFLNTQKLSAKSRLTRGHTPDVNSAQERLEQVTPDDQAWTIWETIANTIGDADLTLYLVLDEAHRGFDTKTTKDKPTIVRRLVNGHAGYPPVPIVWGISATIQRFNDAMEEAASSKGARRNLPNVEVPPSKVQDSGLIKDTLVLDIPEEGGLDMVLVGRAARKLRDSSERWTEYAQAQELDAPVKPLLILQAPNTPNHDELGHALDMIVKEYPDIRGESVRHVFGEHTLQTFGGWEVDWIEPQRVQESQQVRVLVAKDAISTGWDCPRAEVMVSFRSAQDHTHITQLLGRMVRSPLAQRIPGDDRLNAVDCILPFFDRTTAGNVAKYLTGQLDEMPGGNKRVLYDARELVPNPDVSDQVWATWDALPSLTLPKRGVRPVKRLVTLAHALSTDGVRPDALQLAEQELHAILDAAAKRYERILDTEVSEVWVARGQAIVGTVGATKLTYEQFTERADDRAIRAAFENAKKAFGADIAQSYVNHLAGADDPDDDDSLRDAYVRTAALASVQEVRLRVDKEADDLTARWLDESRVGIRDLPDLRQDQYREIKAMATEPQLSPLSRPRSRLEDFQFEDSTGQIVMSPLVRLHLMADEHGDFPIGNLNDWERVVVTTELARPGAAGWYRNPPRATVDSLTVPYRDSIGNWRSMHPDFVFFHTVRGEIRASIVDPHGHHLDDAAVKLKALAGFAAEFESHFHRIEAIDKVDGEMRVLDMQDRAVRDAVIADDESPVALYSSRLAHKYDAV